MKSNFTEAEYQNAKSEELLSCLCYSCNKPFKTLNKNITVTEFVEDFHENKAIKDPKSYKMINDKKILHEKVNQDQNNPQYNRQ